MSAHARLSPSAAGRWSVCTASVRAIERAIAAGRVRADSSNAAADEGTAAHEIRSDCLDLGFDAHDLVGQSIRVNGVDYPVTEDMATYLQAGIDWIRERHTGGPLLVETRVPLAPWLPGQFGTIDCAFVWTLDEDFETIVEAVVSDLKFGMIRVSPFKNKQQMSYLLGLLDLPPFHLVDRFRIVIDQPRAGGIKEWVCTREELLEFGEWIAARGREALSDDGVFAPGTEVCRYCPLAYGNCAAHEAWFTTELLGLDSLDDLPDLPATESISPEHRARVVLNDGAISKWVQTLSHASLDAALQGNPDPGLKAVEGDLGDRKWTDPAAAEVVMLQVLGDAAHARKPLSPTQAEKLMAPRGKNPGHPIEWATLGALITRAPGAPTLAAADDSRPEYAALDLDELDDF